MTNTIFFIPIEDFAAFKEKSPEMGITILSHVELPSQKMVQLDVLADGFTGIYVLGNIIGYAKAYAESTEAMNNALQKVKDIQEKFSKLEKLKSQLENLKKEENGRK